jgi:hypothetical protein
MNEETKKDEKEETAVEGKQLPEEKESPSRVTYTRKQTGKRILATLLFGIVIGGILEIIIILVVIFQLIYALITKEPNIWMIGFANRTISYFRQVMRYLVFSQDQMPFPFSGFPEDIEKPEFK